MAHYIDRDGNLREINRRFILSVRRHIVEDMEREFYKKLSPAYRKKFTEKKWVREQSVGRLFMTGDKDESLYSEFFRIFYPQAMEQSMLILHDIDESHNVVTDMFEMFRTRRKYVRNKEIADLQKLIREKERLIRNRDQKISFSQYKESKSYENEMAEIQRFMSEIEDMKSMIEDIRKHQMDRQVDSMSRYDGMTYDEIYEIESRDFQKSKDNEWFSDDKPISGYIAISAKNLSLMRFNNMQKDIVISMSKLNGSSADNEDEEVMDIAHKRNSALHGDDHEEDIDTEREDDIYDPDRESQYDDVVIREIQRILETSNGGEIIHDFLFGNLSYDELKDKYGFNTVGAVKSRIHRLRTNLRERYAREKESEKILERQIPNGIITKYFTNGEISSIKSETEYRNYEPVKRTEYYENGKIKRRVRYKHGSYDGGYMEFYENGKKSKQGVYEDGKKSGEWISYHENGKIDEIVTHHEDGKTKSFEVYSETGKLEQKGVLVDGVLIEHTEDGIYTKRWDNGNVRLQGNIKKKRIGIWNEYDRSGNLICKYNYRKNGTCEYEFYDMAGNVVARGTEDMEE